MWKWVLIISLVLAAPSFSFWEKSRFYERQTQSLRLDFRAASTEGVLFLKHFKYNSPVYLISTFEDQRITKTRMVSELHFYEFFETVHAWLQDSSKVKGNEACEKSVAVTVSLTQGKPESSQLCWDSLPQESRETFTRFILDLKKKL